MRRTLREADLQPGLPGASVAHEDVEDEFGAVDDPHAHELLEVAPLRHAQVVVEDHQVGFGLGHQLLELFQLALAQEGARRRSVAALVQLADHVRAGGVGQLRQLGKVCVTPQASGHVAGGISPLPVQYKFDA